MWCAFAEKVQGYSHKVNNRICQDAFDIFQNEHCVIVSVADGHGSAACPYSDEGSQMATSVAIEICKELCANGDEVYDLLATELSMHLPKRMETRWKERIRKHHEQESREEVDNIPLLYGTTLLVLVITKHCVASLQIGDGDILSVYENAETTWFIEPEKQTGTETYSMCHENAWKYIRTKIVPVLPDMPVMFLLSTDGYKESYEQVDGFLEIGKDYMNVLKKNGKEAVESVLASWLDSTSLEGCGDDITLALVYNNQ